MATMLDESIAAPAMGSGGAPRPAAPRGRNFEEAMIGKAAGLVKGVGHVTNDGVPLNDIDHGSQIFTKSHDAIMRVRSSVHQGINNGDDVMRGLSPDFLGQSALGMMAQKGIDDGILRKNFTAQNLGLSGTPYGLVPFDLLAPSRLIYPVYTLFRNKFPRPAGQGLSRQVYGLLGISGSQTGGQGVIDISMSELTNLTGGGAGSLANTAWPLSLPKNGSQTEYKLNVPYKFFGLSESLSWLAQFQSQGFEDISALANLVLLQEMMLGEEYQMLAGSSQNLATPAAVSTTVRNAGANETALAIAAEMDITVTALNYFGETVASTAANATPAAGQVVDVAISPVPGAQQYNVYWNAHSSTPYLGVGTSVQSGTTYTGKQSANSVGGYRVTLQGATPGSGNGASPAADTGTGSSNRMEGLIPVLSGLSDTGSGPYANVGFESGNVWQGGYVNQSVGTHLSTNAIFTALDALWENNGLNNVAPGVYKADPSEIVADGGDLMRLANDMLNQGAGLNYLLNIDQNQISGIRAGAAVAEFVNPVTRSYGEADRPPLDVPGHCAADELPAAADVESCR